MIKKYLIFCSLLIMVFCTCFITSAASGEVYPGGVQTGTYYTSSDNLDLEYMDFLNDDFIGWYNESLLDFPYVLDDRDLDGSYYVGDDNLEMTYEVYIDGLITDVSSSIEFRILNLSFGQSFLPLDSSSATTIRLFLDSVEDRFPVFTYRFNIEGLHWQFIEDEWIQVPYVYSNSYMHAFSSDDPIFDFNYIDMFGDDLRIYASNNILNVSNIYISIENSNRYEGTIDRHYIYYRKLNTDLTSSSEWSSGISLNISDFGSSLLVGVGNFLNFEFYPGFSLLNLLYLIVGIPLLIAILKLFLGG